MTELTQAILLSPRDNSYSIQPSPPTLPSLWQPTNSEPSSRWLTSDGQRRVAAIAGLAAVVTSANVAQVLSRTPEYEGKFQLSVEPAIANRFLQNPTFSNGHERAVPTIDYETQIEILRSAALLTPVVDQLQAQDIELDYAALSRNLHIAQLETPGMLEITYRNVNPETVQTVLTQVVDAYLSYGQECQASACKGLQFVDAQIPQVQQRVEGLRQQLQGFQQQGLSDPDAQGQRLSTFSREIANQQAILETTLPKVRSSQTMLQQQIGLPDSTMAETLLERSPDYPTLLDQLQTVEFEIAQESTRFQVNTDKITSLQQQHRELQLQLRLVARQVTQSYLSTNPTVNISESVEIPVSAETAAQWIETTQYIQVLEVRQQSLKQAETLLAQQMKQWATFSRQHSQVKQELHTATNTLNQYLTKRQELEPQAAQQKIAWEVIAPPELIHDHTGQPAPTIPNLQRDLSAGVAFSLLLVTGAAIALDKRKSLNSAIHAKPSTITHFDVPSRLTMLSRYVRFLETTKHTRGQTMLTACYQMLGLPEVTQSRQVPQLKPNSYSHQSDWASTPVTITAELVATEASSEPKLNFVV
jgi:succinoglycan biosynthesis transport protein ExoP